jgi:hypothetical protein
MLTDDTEVEPVGWVAWEWKVENNPTTTRETAIPRTIPDIGKSSLRSTFGVVAWSLIETKAIEEVYGPGTSGLADPRKSSTPSDY